MDMILSFDFARLDEQGGLVDDYHGLEKRNWVKRRYHCHRHRLSIGRRCQMALAIVGAVLTLLGAIFDRITNNY